MEQKSSVSEVEDYSTETESETDDDVRPRSSTVGENAKKGPFLVEVVTIVCNENWEKNYAFAPYFLHINMILTYLASDGTTSTSLKTFFSNDMDAETEKNLINDTHKLLCDIASNGPFYVAQAFFINDNFHVREEFRQMASEKFFTDINHMYFKNIDVVEKVLNDWSLSKTAQSISGLAPHAELEGTTTAIFLTGIYLKAKWKNLFDLSKTVRARFYLNETKYVAVETMQQEDNFEFIYNKQLNAKIIQLPLEQTTLVMVLILPIERDGLPALEKFLRHIDAKTIMQDSSLQSVKLCVPKFNIELQTALQPVFRHLKQNAIFEADANFGKMIEADEPMPLNSFSQKVCIRLNEMGVGDFTEFDEKTPTTLKPNQFFIADHPFCFMVKDANVIYVTGHVTSF